MIQFKVKKEEENQSLEKYIKKALYNYPLSLIYKLFRLKDIKVNNKKEDKHYLVKENDLINVYIKDNCLSYSKDNESIIKEDRISNFIIYEDNNILIINKPRGMLVQKDKEIYKKSLSELVLDYLYFKGEYDPNSLTAYKPGPAHRIDRNTSGIVVFGKNISSLHELQSLIKNKEALKKEYLALVKGEVKNSGIISAPILKINKNNHCVIDFTSKDAKEAISEYYPIKYNKDYSLLDVRLLTGRTHQIRLHMAYNKTPVVGDDKYGDFSLNKEFKKKYDFENQFLHAYKLSFIKPQGILSYLKNKTFEASLNEKMNDILNDIFK